jgi:hypothetical protein
MAPTVRLPVFHVGVHTLLDVGGSLAGSKLDDAEVGEAAPAKWILPHDALDVFSTAGHGQDDAAIAGDFSARDEEMTCRVVHLQKLDVRRHCRVNFGERSFVDELDDEHFAGHSFTERSNRRGVLALVAGRPDKSPRKGS